VNHLLSDNFPNPTFLISGIDTCVVQVPNRCKKLSSLQSKWHLLLGREFFVYDL
jgi:hypothetical protein